MRRILSTLVLAASLVATQGCGDEATTEAEEAPITGTYILASVNSIPLPFTGQFPNTICTQVTSTGAPVPTAQQPQVTSGTLTVTPDGKWTETTSYILFGQTTPTTVTTTGTWTLGVRPSTAELVQDEKCGSTFELEMDWKVDGANVRIFGGLRFGYIRQTTTPTT
jgi:hypothetical protein